MSEFTTSDGCKLFYKDWGTGRPVILIHGWPLCSDSFDSLSLALAEGGFRAIAYDRRGFGRSDQPAAGYEYDRLADDVADLIADLDLSDVTLLGFSMGGGEVARYLSRHGSTGISRAVLISSVVPRLAWAEDNPEGVEPHALDAIEHGLCDDRAKFLAGFFKDFYGVGLLSHPVSEPVLDWSRQMAMRAGLLPTIACAKAFGTTDFRPDLPALTVPTLILHGTDDKTVPIDATARKAVASIGNARLIEYEGHAHGLLATCGVQVAQDVISFLNGPANLEPRPQEVVVPVLPADRVMGLTSPI